MLPLAQRTKDSIAGILFSKSKTEPRKKLTLGQDPFILNRDHGQTSSYLIQKNPDCINLNLCIFDVIQPYDT